MTSALFKRISLLALAACLVAPAALAQNQQQTQDEPEIEVSNDGINMVAELYVDLEELQKEYQARLSQAESSEEARATQQEMAKTVDQTIDDYEGLTSERYDEIIQTAQDNNELREKLLERIEGERERRNE